MHSLGLSSAGTALEDTARSQHYIQVCRLIEFILLVKHCAQGTLPGSHLAQALATVAVGFGATLLLGQVGEHAAGGLRDGISDAV